MVSICDKLTEMVQFILTYVQWLNSKSSRHSKLLQLTPCNKPLHQSIWNGLIRGGPLYNYNHHFCRYYLHANWSIIVYHFKRELEMFNNWSSEGDPRYRTCESFLKINVDVDMTITVFLDLKSYSFTFCCTPSPTLHPHTQILLNSLPWLCKDEL